MLNVSGADGDRIQSGVGQGGVQREEAETKRTSNGLVKQLWRGEIQGGRLEGSRKPTGTGKVLGLKSSSDSNTEFYKWLLCCCFSECAC